jgi:serine/threonine-protein kinase RsbW
MEPQEIKFASAPDSIHLVEGFVNSIFDELNISFDYYGIILTALTEAVDNAIRHGNKNDPAKSVRIIFESSPDGLSFTVKDEGDGFNFNEISDPTAMNEDGSFPEAKGIYKIRSLADKVSFSDDGRAIETTFYVPGINHNISSQRIRSLKMFFKEKVSAVFHSGRE